MYPQTSVSLVSDQISMCAEVDSAESCLTPSTYTTSSSIYDEDKIKFILKEQAEPHSDVGIYDVTFETKLTDYVLILNKPEFQMVIHYPCDNLGDNHPNGLYLGYLPDMSID